MGGPVGEGAQSVTEVSPHFNRATSGLSKSPHCAGFLGASVQTGSGMVGVLAEGLSIGGLSRHSNIPNSLRMCAIPRIPSLPDSNGVF